MVNRLFSLLLICLTFLGSTPVVIGQITITSDDMPSPGDTPYSSIADTLLQIEPGVGGANLNWDFSMLSPISQQKDSFLNVPFAYFFIFGGVDVARFIPTPDSIGSIAVDIAYQFFNKNASQYENAGIGFEISLSPIPIPLQNQPVDVVYRFPLNYGHTDTSYSTAELDLSSFGLFYRTEQTRINEVDAWGSLTTPYGTFDVIRVKTQIMATDTINIDTLGFSINRPLQTNYKWLAKGEVVPVLSINQFRVGGIDQTISVTYRDSVRNLSPVSVDPLRKNLAVKMYPNPTSDVVQLELESRLGKQAQLRILDMQGRIIRQLPVDQQNLSISVSGLPKGTYLLQLTTDEGIFNGKLLIQ